ncbi:MAG: YceH family protein [Elusimicrobiota bacterium]
MIELNQIESRLLGSLVEKSLATPDQYPMTFNSLINACNQKTSRDPVMNLDADVAGQGIHTLIEKGLVERFYVTGSRVPKFKHHIEKLLNRENAKEVGTLCVLLLRGPQTPGEIKTRTDRLCKFADSAEVESLLQDLCAHPEGPMVARLPRQAGQKEARYRHLFSGAVPEAAAELVTAVATAPTDRLTLLEKRVQTLEMSLKRLCERAAGLNQLKE